MQWNLRLNNATFCYLSLSPVFPSSEQGIIYLLNNFSLHFQTVAPGAKRAKQLRDLPLSPKPVSRHSRSDMSAEHGNRRRCKTDSWERRKQPANNSATFFTVNVLLEFAKGRYYEQIQVCKIRIKATTEKCMTATVYSEQCNTRKILFLA